MRNSDKDAYSIPMINRACQILIELSKKRRPVGVTELCNLFDLPKSTVFRILYTLSQYGFVDQCSETERYKLGLNLINLGETVKSNMDIVSIAQPFMEELAKESSETVNLGVKYNSQVIILKNVKGESSIIVSHLSMVTEIYCSSIGKVLMIDSDEREIKEYFLNTNIIKRTINTIVDVNEFIEHIRIVKDTNVAYDNEEFEYGLSCIASPIYDYEGKTVAALGISGPTNRIKIKGIDILSAKVKYYASMISNELGYIL